LSFPEESRGRERRHYRGRVYSSRVLTANLWMQRHDRFRHEMSLLAVGWGAIMTSKVTELTTYDEGRQANWLESETEKRYRVLAENVVDVICALDLDMRVTYVSPSVTHVLGYSVEEALGQHWERWIDTALTARSAGIVARDFKEIKSSVRRGREESFKSWTMELEFVRKDGSTLWTESKVSILRGADGRPTGFVGIVRDIAARKRSEEALMRSESQLRLLSQRILQVQEEERARIARELHDQLGQELVALKIEAVSLAEKLAHYPVFRDRAGAVLALAERLDATSHRIAVSIRPEVLDELGLAKAVQWYAEDFERRTGISCPVESWVDEIELPKQTAICAYRIVQEALTNVWKHSGASQVKIKVAMKDSVLMVSVSDNGAGLDPRRSPDTPSLGLLGMHERASLVGGSLTVKRNRGGHGTRVVAQLPITDGHGQQERTNDGEGS